MPPIHEVAVAGFAEGTNDLYDKARPSYPDETLDALFASLPSKDSLNVLELGSGTGIFTRALLTHRSFGPAVRELKAVEPSRGMREAFLKAVSDPRVSTYEGSFELTRVPDGWADLIVIAQAWHWCPDFNKAMFEFSRSLKPEGVVAFIWNMEDRDSAQWVAQVRDLYEAEEMGTPQYRLGLWRQTFDTEGYKKHFATKEELWLKRNLPTTDVGVIDRVLSKSHIAVLADERKHEIRTRIQAILTRGNDKVWINEAGAVFEYPYTTHLVIIKHKSASGSDD
ncbi:S-adenosyl-L-methionine-dependent methyltransferase [Cantharellus anzutake]|uniref:S-adenosyl-L-methionine-dependent methyltransferase n=1 Tax=Cantharellus anzutake TaxID=1750568 RepID=UPI001907E9C2|nr:S-adenosyl-L-methionine-dependent methyltransferase [Cantharellus anzutake]KAF8334181.1 S-adenosyl-L-methionine-dependent methyltransferase [Cantharellus anzutake]